jgi:hypothetical protein
LILSVELPRTGVRRSNQHMFDMQGVIAMRQLFHWFFRTARRTDRTILRLTSLEGRETPATGFTASGAAVGAAPVVTVLTPSGAQLAQFNAYDPIFLGGVNTAVGEIDGNPNTIEVVTGAGAGGGPHVKVFSINETTGAVSTLASFMAYDPSFRGGVNVATGGLTSATVDDVITGAGPGGGPHVRVFSIGANGTATQIPGPLGSFMAFNPAFRGGVNVATGNVGGSAATGDQLIVGAGPGGGPHVRVLNADGSQFASFMAFDPTFTGGVSLGATGSTGLTVSSLTGGGVTQFGFAPGGVITPTIVTPLTTATALGTTTAVPINGTVGATNTGTTVLGTGLNGTTVSPVTTPNGLSAMPVVPPNVTVVSNSGLVPATGFGGVPTGTGVLSTGTTVPSPVAALGAPDFNTLGFSNLTATDVAANGVMFPSIIP